jgi:outer membrane protein assembly factor BamB
MRNILGPDFKSGFAVLVCLVLSSASFAVSSKVTRHTSSSDLLKGRNEKVVIGSRGTIQLGRAAEPLIKQFKGFDDVWSINSIVVSGGTVYFGTSPNGGIYKYSLNKLKKIYPLLESSIQDTRSSSNIENQESSIEDAEEYLSNEHIFAMATDVAGRLLAGISGKECRLCRLKGEKMETVFEPEPDDAKYIFALALDESGNIYLGTGPEGKIYKLNSLGKKPQLLYDSRDKNILSLAVGTDGYIYAGSDTRGLIYKIHPGTKKVTVLYDSEQPEITALLPVEGSGSGVSLYVAATSAKIVQTQTKFAATTLASTAAGRSRSEKRGKCRRKSGRP